MITAFRILGPVEAWCGERRLEIGGQRQLALLAFLVLHANRPVSSDLLIDGVWGSDPAGAPKRLQMAVARLRRVIAPLERPGETRLRTVRGGYMLSVGSDELDADVFERLVAEGRRALEQGQTEPGREQLQAALALWRGPVLAEVAFEEFAQPEIRRLEELRLAALETRIEADLELGQHDAVVGELESLLARYPTRERLAARLMLAYYRAGRQADALEVFQRTRAHLTNELGLEAGPVLKALQAEILEQSPALDRGAGPRRLSPGDHPPIRSAHPAPKLPAGPVTMLFTDIEGSTALLQRIGNRFGDVLGRHHALIREIVDRYGGVEVSNLGDGLFASFANPRAALDVARDVQDALAHAQWPEGVEVRVRIGIHTGEASVCAGTYWGEEVHYAARMAAAAHGGQVLVSAATAALVPDVQLLDLGEHRLKDFPVARRLLQLGATRYPRLRTIDPLRSNLPTSPGPLVARERELAELVELLRSGSTRLVTITGAGGAGKTRLALAVAETLAGELPDGAFFVPLAETLREEDIPAAIMEPLGIRAVGVGDAAGWIAAGFGSRTALVVLDNFEHLLDAAPLVGRLLAAAPGLRLLVTSQAPLRLRGEHITVLGPLAAPTVDTVAGVKASPAGRLLLDRTAEVAPQFELTAEVASSLAALCRVLNGLPLALELVAPRLAAISPHDLLARVRRGIDAVGHGTRDLPPRQRGLRAALEWTYQLLSEPHAAVLRRLSVFAGPVSLERVERVCGDGIDTLEALAHLVDLSLVARAGDGRFALHAAVRAFARDKLVQAGDSEDAHSGHAWAYAEAATAWGRRFLLEVDEVQASARAEEADLGDALMWASRENLECFARAAGGASMSLVLSARIARFRELIEAALNGEPATIEARAWLWLAGSLAALHEDDLPLARERVREAIASADQSGDRWLSCVMRTCSILNQTMGECDPDVRAQYADLRRHVAQLHDEPYRRLVEGIDPYLLLSEGRIREAEPLLARLMQSRPGSDFAARMAVYDWPDCLLAAGEHGRALVAFGVALKTARDRAETVNMAYQLDGIAAALCGLEKFELGLEAAGWAEAVHKTAGPRLSVTRRSLLGQFLERSRVVIGPTLAEAVFARGSQLSLEAAVAAGLRVTDQLSPEAPGRGGEPAAYGI